MKNPIPTSILYKLCLLTALAVGFISETMAQAKGFKYGYEFKPRRRKVVVPFELYNNLMVIKITINKSDTLNFVMDTGVSMNILTDPDVAASLGLNYVRKIDITGLGEGEMLSARVAINNEINMTGIVANGQNVVSLEQDVLAMSSYVGMPVHGVLGYDIFKNFIVKINYKDRVLTLYDPKHYKVKKRHGTRLPITLEGGKPYIEAEITQQNGEKSIVKLIVDTGAGNGLLLERTENCKIEVPVTSNYRLLGRGLGGKIWGYEGRINELCLGDYSLKNVISSFPDSNKMRSKVIKLTGRSGNLGCEILKRFDVVFNYGQNYIALKPNKKHILEQPFERDMSGMIIRAHGPKFNNFFVETVDKGSPAYQAGIQAGDEIVVINKRMYHHLKLDEIYRMLNKDEGKEVLLVMKRGDEIYSTQLRLKRTI